MVSVKKKKIKGRIYMYAEYSFRMPDNRIKKISKFIRRREDKDNKETKEYFLRKETEAYQEYALNTYKSDTVLTKEKLKKLESIRTEYREILKKLTKSNY
jgi:hypothetical protein